MIVKPDNCENLIKLLVSKPLVLYGMGGAGLRIAKWCDSQGIDYVFADNAAPEKQNETNKTVILPELLKERYKDVNIVVSSIMYYNEIIEGLLRMGFVEEQILSYKLFMPENIVWSDLDSNIDWDLMRFRVEMFCEWIDADIKSVADYGAGKMFLKEYLSGDVQYFPIDYIKRNEKTILCDLNLGDFPEVKADAAICSGVLEFIYTAELLLAHVCKNTSKIVILSYLTIDKFSDVEGRRASAYVSDLSEKQIIDSMSAGGFVLEKSVPDPMNSACTVYMFKKVKGEKSEIDSKRP